MSAWLDDLSEDWPSQPPTLNASLKSISNIPRPQSSIKNRSALGKRTIIPNGTVEASFDSLDSVKRTTISVGSASSNAPYSTVEVRSQPASPQKTKSPRVPEWKSRLLGNLEDTQQTDLFGPSRIERIFQRPASPKENKTNDLSFLRHLDTVPSSPPWPTKNLENVVEDEDETENISPSPGIRNLPHSDHSFNVSRPSQSSTNFSQIANRLRQASGQSNNDSFSAVFISKHNTTDGGIAYAPIDLSRSELAEQLSNLKMPKEDCDNSELPTDLPTDLPVGTPDLPQIGEFVTIKRGGYSDQGSFRKRPLSPSPLAKNAPLQNHDFVQSSEVYSIMDDNEENKTQGRISSVLSRFGEGQLADHEFSVDFESLSENIGDDLPSRSPSPDVLPPGCQHPFKFRRESSVSMADVSRHKRISSAGLSIAKRSSTKPNLYKIQPREDSNLTIQEAIKDGKRPPPSPNKISAPKRRRTLLENETSTLRETNPSFLAESRRVMSIAKGKRKDSKTGPIVERAEEEVLARRHILRPRNPTPSQRRRNSAKFLMFQDEVNDDESYDELNQSNEDQNLSQMPPDDLVLDENRLQTIEESLAESIRDSVIAYGIATLEDEFGMMDDEQSRRSVTTQGFLDEAMKIMNSIRNKGRPGQIENGVDSRLDDVVEEGTEPDLQTVKDESIYDSRPPSREDGKGGWRTRNDIHRSPSILERLAKYKEEDEEEAYIRSSIASNIDHKLKLKSRIQTIESEPSGISILGHSIEISDEHDIEDGPASSNSHPTATSGASSFGRTTASKKSDTVNTIPPEAVAGIIPESIAGLHFDRENNVWVRSQKTSELIQSDPRSEDDPFNNISDLTVDSEEEADRLLEAQNKAALAFEKEMSSMSQDLDENGIKSITPIKDENTLEIQQPTKSQPSLHIQGNGSANNISLNKIIAPVIHISKQLSHKLVTELEIIENYESNSFRESSVDDCTDMSQLMNDAFGSLNLAPGLLTQISGTLKTPLPRYGDTIQTITKHNPTQIAVDDQKDQPDNVTSNHLQIRTPSRNFKMPSFLDKQHHSIIKEPPMIVQCNAPIIVTSAQSLTPFTSPGAHYSSFLLSELDDLTVHQPEELYENRLIRSGTQYPTYKESRFQQGDENVVKVLTDTLGRLTYWEELRGVDLEEKGLVNIRPLNNYLPSILSLNLSKNQIRTLEGVPLDVEELIINSNKLTSLTSFSHLTNLINLIMDDNELTDLHPLRNLPNLRVLRASGNQIKHMNGLEDAAFRLGQLILPYNEISGPVFLPSPAFKFLQILDLSNNEITSLRGLNELEALTYIDVSNNHLESFSISSPAPVTRLCLSNNLLTKIEIDLPNAVDLTLAIRNNKLSRSEDICLMKNMDITTILMGGNSLFDGLGGAMPNFQSVQNLELAACGLAKLPSLAGLNRLKYLNLSLNQIDNISGVEQASNLECLLLAKNNLSALRSTAVALSRLSKLNAVDCRFNSITAGFYQEASHMLNTDVKSFQQFQVHTGQPENVGQKALQLLEEPPNSQPETDLVEDRAHKAQDFIQSFPIPLWEGDEFTCPLSNGEDDTMYGHKMSKETALRKRLWEVLMKLKCPKLMLVDGRMWKMANPLKYDPKDKPFLDRLVRLKILVCRTDTNGQIVYEFCTRSDGKS